MINLNSVVPRSGNFPSMAILPCSSAAVKDGTPITAAMHNDTWGLYQALMTKAGLTPSGSNETYSVSQLAQALRIIHGGAGELVPWMGTVESVFTALGLRLIKPVGQRVLCADYPELVEACYIGDDHNIDPGAPFTRWTASTAGYASTSGLYFQLPDLQGLFPRGEGLIHGRSFGGSSMIGQIVSSTVKEHRHILFYGTGTEDDEDTITTYAQNGVQVASGSGYFVPRYSASSSPSASTPGLRAKQSFTGSSANETRPYNFSVHWMLRY